MGASTSLHHVLCLWWSCLLEVFNTFNTGDTDEAVCEDVTLIMTIIKTLNSKTMIAVMRKTMYKMYVLWYF